MDFKITSIENSRRLESRPIPPCGTGKPALRSGGFSLIETLVTIGVTAICLLALASFFLFSTHSFATLFNYVDLDDLNRIAMDQLTSDVRQAICVKSYTTNTLTLTDSDSVDLTYAYDPATRKLTRTKNNVSKVLLNECDRLSFRIDRKSVVNGKYETYPVATTMATAKVIDVSWMCSRTIFGFKEDTESVQTARIVIRKQGT